MPEIILTQFCLLYSNVPVILWEILNIIFGTENKWKHIFMSNIKAIVIKRYQR